MNAIDPRSLSDRDLFVHLALGPIPRKGWPGRGRLIARRLVELGVIAAATLAGLWVALVYATAFLG